MLLQWESLGQGCFAVNREWNSNDRWQWNDEYIRKREKNSLHEINGDVFESIYKVLGRHRICICLYM